jgi:Fe-S cluster assembly ATP-binding protein
MLELRNISYNVEDEGKNIGIVKNVSLVLPDDKFFVITGPNGGGKSSLAKIIAGIYKPTSGQILYNGQDITDMSITDRARLGIGFAFQQPVRFKGLQVLDLIRLAAGKEVTVVEACEYLSEVGLCAKDYINREVNASLSGGELKRIEIATVLARRTNVTLFDEPEAGIDLWSFQNLIQVFRRMREEMHGTIIIISHQERILNIADEIIVLSGGRIEKRGTRDEIIPALAGTPSAVDMCDKLRGE